MSDIIIPVDYLNKFKQALGDIDKLEQTPQIVREMAVGVLGEAFGGEFYH